MATGKNTGIHISLIICAVLMLIFGAVAYLMHKDASEVRAELQTSKDNYRDADTQRKSYLADIGALKNAIGANMETVGQAGSQDPNTVLGFLNMKMQEVAGPLAQPTVRATLDSLRQELNAKDQIIAQLQASENKINQEKLDLTKVYNEMADRHDEAAEQAEQDLQAQIKVKDETVAGITKQLDEERAKNAELQRQYEKLDELLQAKTDDLNNQIEKLTKTNKRLSDQIYELTDMSFDIPDGKIVSVNYETDTVFINLGKEDGLKPGTTFSVYQKSLSNVGGRTSDIKASIEVVRIVNEHTAEAKITSEGEYPGDYSRPIARGDAIYSPLWRAGIQEVFALVGKFDLDGDKTDDRDILINMIRNAGGDVAAQVTPDGERTPPLPAGEITSQFKFLVLGDIGDPSKEPDEAEKAKINKMHAHASEMRKEADQSGVRTITMNDFLAYMGYKPQRRLWRPGENIPWIMTTRRDANRSRRDIRSQGTVSGAYNRSNRDVDTPR